MGWTLIAADNAEMKEPCFFRDDCTCADHCKEIARKVRKTHAEYNPRLFFEILGPGGYKYARAVSHSGGRLRWWRDIRANNGTI